MQQDHRIVVDLGGTNLTVGSSPDRKSFEWIRSSSIDQWDPPEEWITTLLSNQPETHQAEWILGLPGPCRNDGPERTPNLPEKWDFSQIKALLSRKGVTFHFENDAHLAALGMQRQIKETYDCFLGVTLGTGIGGGIVQKGALYRGSTGAATEIGHITVQPDGRLCGCGKNGCLETYASARGLEKTYEELNGTDRPAHEIADANTQKSQKCFHITGRYLGKGLATVVNILNPDRIQLAGGLAESFDQFRDSMRKSFRRNVFAESARRTPIERHKTKYPALHGGLSLSVL